MRKVERGSLLREALTQPDRLRSLSTAEWSLLLREARVANLHCRLAHQAEDIGTLSTSRGNLRDALEAAQFVSNYHRRCMRWEIARVQSALGHLDARIILLKGAAYEMAGLPPAFGRLASDLDIMVEASRLTEVEHALLENGWRHVQQDEYDQRYFRSWMHELPPLVHGERGTMLDVHHAILPRTSRLKPSTELLWQDAVALPDSRLFVLSPVDLVLHSAAHAFHDGELRVALRDLVDVRDLVAHFGKTERFWEKLVARAGVLGLERPLFYALRYARSVLDSEIPDTVTTAMARHAPPGPVLFLMDTLIPKVILPPQPDGQPRANRNATLLLYIRSHWLKMPPLLLTAHLLRKALKRRTAVVQ